MDNELDKLTTIATGIAGNFFHRKRGFLAGGVISTLVGIIPAYIISGLLVRTLTQILMAFELDTSPFGIYQGLPQIFFFLIIAGSIGLGMYRSGTYQIPVKNVAVLYFLKRRLCFEEGGERQGIIQEEGDAWYLPPVLGGKKDLVSMKEIPLDLIDEKGNLPSFLTTDKIRLGVDADLLYQVENAYLYLETEDPIGQVRREALDQLRFIVGAQKSETITSSDSAKQLSAMWLYGDAAKNGDASTGKPAHPEYATDKKGLLAEIKRWGIKVTRGQISNFVLPPEIEEAAASRQKEAEERKAEKTEAEGVAELMDIYINKGLSPELASNMVQVERGKGTRSVTSIEIPAIGVISALAGSITDKVLSHMARNDDKAPEGNDDPPAEKVDVPVEGTQVKIPFKPTGRRADSKK